MITEDPAPIDVGIESSIDVITDDPAPLDVRSELSPTEVACVTAELPILVTARVYPGGHWMLPTWAYADRKRADARRKVVVGKFMIMFR